MPDRKESKDWYDNHPLASDILMLIIPSILMSGIWFVLTQDLFITVFQAISTPLFIGLGIVYLERKSNKKVFRYITSTKTDSESN